MVAVVTRLSQRALFLTCAAVAALSAPAAFAQEAEISDEVVVTADRGQAQNILDVPQAVSAVSSEQLEELHATQLTDIGAYVPALQVDSGGTPGQTSISIRGIAPVGPGATVATYIDESPIGTTSAYGGGVYFALDLLPYDVQRLEVLRGPQGTLYGASSMGGLLKYVLTTPSMDHFEGRIGGDVFAISDAGDTGYGARVSLNGPLVEGVLAALGSYSFQHTPGFIDNSETGAEDQNDFEQESARLALLWNVTPNLSVALNGLYQRADADGYGTVALDPVTQEPIGGARTDNNLRDNTFSKTIEYVSATVNYEMSWANFVSASSFSNTDTDSYYDASYNWGVALGPPGAVISQSTYRLELSKLTQEFRLQTSDGGSFDWLFGVFGSWEDSSNFQSADLQDGATGIPLPGISPIFSASLPSEYTEAAAFGGLTFHLNDRWDVFGGVRYSTNWQSFSEIAYSPILGTPFGSELIIDIRDRKARDEVVTYNVGTRVNLSDDVMMYARVATGYQPGGPNLVIAGVPPTFDADTLTNYEVGLKGAFFDRRVTFDGALFNIDWEDIQVLTGGGGFNYGANGGTARSAGAEATLSIRPTDRFTIDSTVAYVNAVLTEDAPLINGEDGDRLPNIPEWSGSVRMSYEFPLSAGWDGEVGGGVRYVGERYSAVNSDPISAQIEDYTALDLDGSISSERFTFRLFVKNVTDEDGYTSYEAVQNAGDNSLSQYEGTLVQPRTIGIALDARF